MGHVTGKVEYLRLQQRLDRMPIGAPAHRALFDILEELFTPEECRVAAAIPLKVASLETIARNAGLPEARTRAVLEGLASKGLVLDLPSEDRPTRYFLNPTIVGFFEFTMMRVRPEVDQKRVAELIWAYLREDPELGFLRMMSEGETFIGRPLVYEDALVPQVWSEILDWEKASDIVEQAGSWAEGLCHCRHVKAHLGERCSHPEDHCLSLGMGADYLVRNGMSRRIDVQRARDILATAKERRLVHMADNIRDQPTFICNCCACCCEMLEGLRILPGAAKVVSSNFVASSSEELCTGCGKCAKACPVDAIEMRPAGPTQAVPRRKKRAVVDPDPCLGCGVCHAECEFGGISLSRAAQRVYTPESVMERLVLQAIERGKLQHLIFNDPARLTHRVLSAFLGALLALPPAKQLMARRQVKSTFVDALLGSRRGRAGETAAAR